MRRQGDVIGWPSIMLYAFSKLHFNITPLNLGNWVHKSIESVHGKYNIPHTSKNLYPTFDPPINFHPLILCPHHRPNAPFLPGSSLNPYLLLPPSHPISPLRIRNSIHFLTLNHVFSKFCCTSTKLASTLQRIHCEAKRQPSQPTNRQSERFERNT